MRTLHQGQRDNGFEHQRHPCLVEVNPELESTAIAGFPAEPGSEDSQRRCEPLRPVLDRRTEPCGQSLSTAEAEVLQVRKGRVRRADIPVVCSETRMGFARLANQIAKTLSEPDNIVRLYQIERLS